jgi:hypothetical protein
MPILTLRPESDQTTGIPSSTGGSHYTEVDEETADTNTYVYDDSQGGAWKTDLYGLPNHTTEAGTINSVKIYIRCYGGHASDQCRTAIYSDSTQTNGTAHSPGATWTTYDETYTTNPADDQAWTWTDIDNLQAGVGLYSYNNKNSNARCTQVYVEVDYTPPVIYLASGSLAQTPVGYRLVAAFSIASSALAQAPTGSHFANYYRAAQNALAQAPTIASKLTDILRSALANLELAPYGEIDYWSPWLKRGKATLALVASGSRAVSVTHAASKTLALWGGIFEKASALLSIVPKGLRGVTVSKITSVQLALAPSYVQGYLNEIVSLCKIGIQLAIKWWGPGRQLFTYLSALRPRDLIVKTWDMFWKAKYVYEEYGPYRNRGVLRMKPWGGMGVSQKWGSGGVKMAPEAWAIAHPQRGVSNVSLAGIGFMQRGAAHPYIEETAVIIALDGLAIPIEFQPAAGYVKIDGIGYFDRGTV